MYGFIATPAVTSGNIVASGKGELYWVRIEKLRKSGEIFPPVAYYLPHLLGNTPEIIYNYSIWNNSKLVRVVSEEIDNNS